MEKEENVQNLNLKRYKEPSPKRLIQLEELQMTWGTRKGGTISLRGKNLAEVQK